MEQYKTFATRLGFAGCDRPASQRQAALDPPIRPYPAQSSPGNYPAQLALRRRSPSIAMPSKSTITVLSAPDVFLETLPAHKRRLLDQDRCAVARPDAP
jgi:hypothetical protein